MKTLLFIFCLLGFLAVGFATHCHGDSVGSSTWRAIWFPPNDTMKSWDWVGGGCSMEIRPVDYSQNFPDEVKQWELAVTSATDPGKKVKIPLGNPHEGASIDSSIWVPGEFRTGMDRLEALGEGTFLCAILGDGRRYSNVSKVTINHSYSPSHEPVIRLVAVQPFGKDAPVKFIGAWIVGPTPVDVDFTTSALSCPTWEVDGKWSVDVGDPSGNVSIIRPGTSYGSVYYVAYHADHPASIPSLAGLGLFQPPIVPFSEAQVRLRICDRYNSFEGIPLTAKQREYLSEYGDSWWPKDSNPAGFKTYISDVFDVHVDNDAMDRFDKAFGP